MNQLHQSGVGVVPSVALYLENDPTIYRMFDRDEFRTVVLIDSFDMIGLYGEELLDE